MGAHLIDGEFQSDKYPTCPRGKVPLSVKDPMARDLLQEYARRRRVVDAEFSDDLEAALGCEDSDEQGVYEYGKSAGRLEERAAIVADMRHIEKFDSDEQTRFVAGLLADRYQSGQHLKEKA